MDAKQFFAINRESHADTTEETLVGKIAIKIGLNKTETLKAARDQLDHPATLGWFCGAYRQFPFFVGYRKTPWQHEAIEDLRKRFTKTPCYTGFSEVKECRPEYDERPVACCFRWPGIGVCVLREVNCVEDPIDNEFSLYVKSYGSIFLIEPFESFLERIPCHQDYQRRE